MFETERLCFRKFTNDDADFIFAMRSDPEIMRYISNVQTDRKESIVWIEKFENYWKKYNMGICAVLDKSTDQPIGWCGLMRLKDTDEIEVAYAIVKSAWGNGYATEAADRMLRYGFDDLKLERIVAIAYPENLASQQVMKKLGMTYVKTGEFFGEQLRQFAIERKDYARN